MPTVLIGDLFKSDAQTITNAVNCVGVMGKGIARDFKERFPAMYSDYKGRCERGEVRVGEPYLYGSHRPPWILNFPTKDHWRSKSRLEHIVRGLQYLVAHYQEWGVTSLALPALGCGLGGLTWADVDPILYQHAASMDIPVELYAPSGTPREQLGPEFLAGTLTAPEAGTAPMAAATDGRTRQASMTDRRLIEDYLPIEAISAEASREKSIRKGHISTLHLWWARRPLVACRAAVYGALVPASRFIPENGPDNKKQSLGRANAAKFVERLCKYPGDPAVIAQAQEHILEAHADRLTEELSGDDRPAWAEEFGFTGDQVTVEDIKAGRAPRPRVLDMFAGGGSIPLEALRLGCEAYALDLNPVAHIIELCTLVYPQKYGKPDPAVPGMKGPPNAEGQTTWGGLAEEVRWWGNWVLERVRREIGDLYPPVPDPDFAGKRPEIAFDSDTGHWVATDPNLREDQQRLLAEGKSVLPPGYLTPVAYLWTRTVTCKNPSCAATVPLVKQTWLCKKKGRNVALKIIAPRGARRVSFQVVEAATEQGLGFDPSLGSKGGNATCPFCGTVADSTYVKAEGCAKRMGEQMMAVVSTRPGRQGKTYLSADDLPEHVPDDAAIQERIEGLCGLTGLTVPDEPIEANPRSMDTQYYGYGTWGELFTPRQALSHLSFIAAVRDTGADGAPDDHSGTTQALVGGLSCAVSKLADMSSSLCTLLSSGGRGIKHTFARQALPMVWDYAEANPLNEDMACWLGGLREVAGNVAELTLDRPAVVVRGSAGALLWDDGSMDAVLTDPPYYDNVTYSNLSDFFFVWLKRVLGDQHPEHFTSDATPKKQEMIAASYRHGGSRAAAALAYEEMLVTAFREAGRVLKSGAPMAVVYAHKTTLGWATPVDAMRVAGFVVTEAWPLDTETRGRLIAQDTAALASSIFLVARKRTEGGVGAYETVVRPELDQVVRDRVRALWDMGVTGADLLIAAVGAGLRAFTRFERVEYANGEEVPAEKFLAEVEGVVLETLLERIFGVSRSGVAAVDGPSRFYVLWRYTYGAAEMDAGEAIVFSYSQDVELDGPEGLSTGTQSLVEKKKGKYRLRDFAERGKHEKLGLPRDDARAPLIDVLHRALWLIEHHPRDLNAFLDEAKPDAESLRLVAETLAGTSLRGGPDRPHIATTATEQSALGKLLTNWGHLVEERVAPPKDLRLEL